MKTILAIDDDVTVHDVLNEVLSEDYKIIDAYDGKEGLKKFDKNRDKVSLVLLDMTMPDQTGLEVLKQLKSRDLGDIPVVMLTSVSEHDVESASIDAGAVDYITKPINVKVMKARLRAHIALRQNTNKAEAQKIIKDRVKLVAAIINDTLESSQDNHDINTELVAEMRNLRDVIGRVYGD